MARIQQSDEKLDQHRISRNDEKQMDGGHIQEANSVKMGDRLGTVDKKDGP